MDSDSVITYASSSRAAGRSRVATILLITLGVIAGVLLGAAAYILPHGRNIAAGVTVLEQHVSGLSEGDATAVVQEAFADFSAQRITLTAGAHTAEVTLADLGVQPNVERTVRQALAVGRDGAIHTRLLRAAEARWSGLSLTPSIDIDEQTMEETLTAFGGQTDVQPADATIRWDADMKTVVIVPEQRGARLDIPASVKVLIDSAVPAVKNATALPTSLDLVYEEQLPKITGAMLAGIDTMLSEFTTSYATSSRSRASNVETATRSINGTILKAGEEFSYNTVVGPRDRDSGFVLAPVIVNGQLVPGMGGGICQVSTTLYNAALLANLQITLRSHHSLAVHYVPLGQDATVAYGALDLRFKNSTAAPIFIEATTSKRKLTMRIFGKGPAPVVRIERTGFASFPGRTTVKKDPTLPLGARVVEKKGSGGRAVTVIRVVGEGPDAVREVVSKDRYIGEPAIIRMGTGKAVSGEPADASATNIHTPVEP
ncbi:MAG: VanW family protein [Armatimonadota bacterium]